MNTGNIEETKKTIDLLGAFAEVLVGRGYSASSIVAALCVFTLKVCGEYSSEEKVSNLRKAMVDCLSDASRLNVDPSSLN